MTVHLAKVGEDALMTNTCLSNSTLAKKNVLHISWFKRDYGDGETQWKITVTKISIKTEGSGRYLSKNGSIIISNVKVEDTGYYLCERFYTAQRLSSLIVYYLKAPVLEPKEKHVNENENATFTCPLPDGVPTPITITWIKDGTVLDVSDTKKYPQSDTTLEISRVNYKDTGDYQCRAENAAYSGDEGKLSDNTGTLSLVNREY
ncbi:carcinoembryonic antigen-related cell adhesion molecule 1-like [Anneissia japonica]|uniref:carcinoembryonic antigen-related cell adhesion molecule 1-like n=1 Tax=Anneissia japonica TaxID=1529436 RepID=UPI00142598CD|nr:carcinoembryonic antigen-related cell adhesion molecule 1-like [Anneissia japonica]